MADGESAFQEASHLHLHVFPRFWGGSFRLVEDWSVKRPCDDLDGGASPSAAPDAHRKPASCA